MSNLKIVNFQESKKRQEKYRYVFLCTSCALYFSLSFVYFRFGDFGFPSIFQQVEVLLSFLIGTACTRVGKNAIKVMYSFCIYSAYILVVDNIFPSPSTLQWFLEVVLFVSFVYYISIGEKIRIEKRGKSNGRTNA